MDNPATDNAMELMKAYRARATDKVHLGDLSTKALRQNCLFPINDKFSLTFFIHDKRPRNCF